LFHDQKCIYKSVAADWIRTESEVRVLGIDRTSRSLELKEKNPSQTLAEFDFVEKVNFREPGKKVFRLIFKVRILTLTIE